MPHILPAAIRSRLPPIPVKPNQINNSRVCFVTFLNHKMVGPKPIRKAGVV